MLDSCQPLPQSEVALVFVGVSTEILTFKRMIGYIFLPIDLLQTMIFECCL